MDFDLYDYSPSQRATLIGDAQRLAFEAMTADKPTGLVARVADDCGEIFANCLDSFADIWTGSEGSELHALCVKVFLRQMRDGYEKTAMGVLMREARQ